MSKINLGSDEFGDIVIAFLFDKLLHDNEILPDNERLNSIADKMNKTAMKSNLLKAYRDMDPTTRVKYKRIKDTFDYSSLDKAIIEIKPKGEREEEKPKKEKLLKKIIKKIVASSEFTEEEIEILNELSGE